MELEDIDLVGGNKVDVCSGVTVIVGPNNAGKSTFLREIHEALGVEARGTGNMNSRIVSNVNVTVDESQQNFIDKLKRALFFYPTGHRLGHPNYEVLRVRNSGTQIPLAYAEDVWRTYKNGEKSDRGGIGQLSEYFAMSLSADGRVNLLNDTTSFDAFSSLPRTPLQHLFNDRGLERRADSIIYETFGKNIVLNRHGGNVIQLQVGKLSVRDSLYPSDKLKEEFQELPTVQEQGDGFRSFTGMVLAILTGQAPMILIDEPEAFLHPPQARRFGRFLAQQHSNGTKIIIATHSEDILSGVTSVPQASGSVSVLRLTRKSETSNSIAQLKPADVKDIYTDPLMKYYDMLNGLFTNGVIVCEADSDCTFYRAVLDDAGPEAVNSLDLHFTHCGGKGRLSKALRMFRAVKVPVACVVDIDILDKPGEFDALVNSSGGDIQRLKPMRDKIAKELNGLTEGPLKKEALEAIGEQFKREPAEEKVLPRDVSAVKKIINVRSGWKEFKRHGVEALEVESESPLSSGAQLVFDALDLELRKIGIFMVRVGELERFHPELGVAKERWLAEALEKKVYTNSPLALDMLKGVAKFIEHEQDSL